MPHAPADTAGFAKLLKWIYAIHDVLSADVHPECLKRSSIASTGRRWERLCMLCRVHIGDESDCSRRNIGRCIMQHDATPMTHEGLAANFCPSLIIARRTRARHAAHCCESESQRHRQCGLLHPVVSLSAGTFTHPLRVRSVLTWVVLTSGLQASGDHEQTKN